MDSKHIRAATILASLLIAPLAAQADPQPAVQLTYEPQVVEVGINAALFSGSALFPVSAGSTQADGTLVFQFRSGETVTLQIIAAKQLSGRTAQRGKPLLVIAEDLEGDALAPPIERFVVAIVRPAGYYEKGEDIWDFTGSVMQGPAGSDHVQVLADSTRSRVKHEFPQHDFGQIPVAASVIAPLQTVQPINRDDPLQFGAAVGIDEGNSAEGLIFAPLSDRGGEYELTFGAVFPDPITAYHLFLVGVLPNTTDTNGILRATVMPAPDPSGQIWDLVNGESPVPNSRNTATFDADGIVIFD